MKTSNTLLQAGVIAGLALSAFGAAMTPITAQANTPVLKIAHVVPPGDPRDTAANHVADLMRNSDACPMDANVYPSAQLGGTTDLIEGMQLGSIEAVVLPASFLVGFQPIMGLMDFPFFWPTDLDTLLELHQSDAMRQMLDTTESQGVYSMAVWHTGYKQWTANDPLRAPSDYQGKRARVMPSAVLVKQQESLGMTPVDMPFPETYNALQSGAISAQENPITTSYVMGFHEVQDYLIMTNHGNLDQIFMVSRAWFDGLGADCQAELEAAVEEGRELVVTETLSLEERGLEAMVEAGIEVIELSSGEISDLREATLPPVRELFLQRTGDEGQTILEAIESEIGR
ncbi:C4-dicarboxylate-binding protein DctP [Natronocella acetinitrilica]|uniref:C4-dicarboxylate-binding protein DctP n=1 Tax=Natronocella acetinitrilica TaxID=414046 RepID=A0AAE3KAR8_9GAMM|nr:TRAP transporter substrate-binding protein [Natronocella acetinitrilica]MCP1673761.1 C4-dicarboxylate-binding protein DctP [Natronocella acetinitrilica]